MNRQWTLLILALGTLCASARAEDLQTVYEHALQADPTMQQAEANHMATREGKTQAILNMLPLNANASRYWTGIARISLRLCFRDEDRLYRESSLFDDHSGHRSKFRFYSLRE